ncbi:uncharacterized protein LOC131639371 [Vicia villosa]|uniref:uncharacterized protein LOC131639371 n=1 Tax=Vicia villosa TaxID=3911 RepID=UPI00273BC500|nr:uncharacterized protein LOC131639371 [Vicia villosa]
MEGSSLKRSPTTGSRCQEELVEMQPISKRTRRCVLLRMLEEIRAVKKESMDAIEEIEEELHGGTARHDLEREQIAVGCKKGKGKQPAPVIAAGHGRKTYHAAVYRASFQPSASKIRKSYSGSGKQNGEAATFAMTNDGAAMRCEVKKEAPYSGSCGNGERRTREIKDHGTTNASR